MYEYDTLRPCDLCETDTDQRVTVWANGGIELECLECGCVIHTDTDAI